ncbi:MAG: hypothetical protein RQM92_12100 [Candidatus Syntrophopropionicum ammoniitolerans]
MSAIPGDNRDQRGEWVAMILIAFWQRLGIPEKLIRDPAYDEILPLNTELGRLVLENYLQDDIHKWTIWLILAVSIAFIDSVMVVGGWPALKFWR